MDNDDDETGVRSLQPDPDSSRTAGFPASVRACRRSTSMGNVGAESSPALQAAPPCFARTAYNEGGSTSPGRHAAT